MRHGRCLAALLGVLLWAASGHADITNTTPYDYDDPPKAGDGARHLQNGFRTCWRKPDATVRPATRPPGTAETTGPRSVRVDSAPRSVAP